MILGKYDTREYDNFFLMDLSNLLFWTFGKFVYVAKFYLVEIFCDSSRKTKAS